MIRNYFFILVWLCSALCLQGQTLSKGFTAQPIPDSIWHFIQGRSYQPNSHIQRADLRYLKVLHCDYEGRTHQGELVCNKLIATKLLTIFRALYEARYPIERITLPDNYDADDERQMRANNTSCFNYRIVSGSKNLSKHAYGLAIDINPLYNPYIRYSKKDGHRIVEPSTGLPYVDRKKNFRYKITTDDLCYKLFIKHGFTWGGAWRSVKDYQHFEYRQSLSSSTDFRSQLPTLADGIIDTTNYETVGISPSPAVRTVTVFHADEQTDHYANGAVMTAFKGKLYCMWQSSPKDEDSDDTWVAYSVSADDGETWGNPQQLALPTDAYYCTSGGWLVRGDTLTAFIDTWQKGLEPRGGKTNYITTTDGLNWSQMQPVRMADGSEMEGVLEQDPYTLSDGRIIGAAHFMPGLHVCPVYTDDPRGVSGWHKASFQSEDNGKSSCEIEPSQYLQPDGTIVMLFRDQKSSFRKLAAISNDNGKSYSKPTLTNMPDGRTKQCAGNLPDGTAFIVSCPANGKRRWPLILQLSSDGIFFDQAILLRSGSSNDLPPRRYEGRYKTLGYNYPKAILWHEKLYITYSTNKEDVECTIMKIQ